MVEAFQVSSQLVVDALPLAAVWAALCFYFSYFFVFASLAFSLLFRNKYIKFDRKFCA